MSSEFYTAMGSNQFAIDKAMRAMVEAGGPSPFRQMLQILRARLGATPFSPKEYYLYRLDQPENYRRAKATYVPLSRNQDFCRDIAGPASFAKYRGLFHDKLHFEKAMADAGVKTVRTKAVYRGKAHTGCDLLDNAEELERFLGNRDNYPIFGKPVDSSLALGVLSFDGLSDDGTKIRMSTGKELSIKQVAAHIADVWHTGYMLQERVRNHRDLTDLLGKAVGCSRVVTLQGEDGPEVLFAAQRLPAIGASHDNNTPTASRAVAAIDHEGRLGVVRVTSTRCLPDRTHWPVESVQATGRQIPNWDRVVELCKRAHDSFPDLGLIGFDVMHTDDGPILGEMNGAPFMSMLQVSQQKGANSPDFRLRYEVTKKVIAARVSGRT